MVQDITQTCPTLHNSVLFTITLTLIVMFSTSGGGGASKDQSREGEHALQT